MEEFEEMEELPTRKRKVDDVWDPLTDWDDEEENLGI